MANAEQQVTLAMPLGLPAVGASHPAHFANLQSRLSATTMGNVVRAWVADEPAYSALFAMVKGLLRYIPVGGIAPDGTMVTTPMLVLKTWLWDYLELRKNVAPSTPLPKLIGYANVDQNSVALAIRAELGSNPRHKQLAAQQRTLAEVDFLAGTARLVVSAGTAIGRGAVDAAAPPGTFPTYRRVDLQLLNNEGATLDPVNAFDLWGLVGGDLVQGHPLLSILRRPVSPSAAPLEGGTRIRITGTGFVANTSVTIRGQPAVDVWVRGNGQELYATLPSGASGTADVVVTIPGKAPITHTSALTYVSDVVATARGVVQSLAVRLTEIRDRAAELAAANALDAQAKAELSLATDLARDAAPLVIERRARAAGTTAVVPTIAEVWQSRADLSALYLAIRTVVD
jgi:hypothetical protein